MNERTNKQTNERTNEQTNMILETDGRKEGRKAALYIQIVQQGAFPKFQPLFNLESFPYQKTVPCVVLCVCRHSVSAEYQSAKSSHKNSTDPRSVPVAVAAFFTIAKRLQALFPSSLSVMFTFIINQEMTSTKNSIMFLAYLKCIPHKRIAGCMMSYCQAHPSQTPAKAQGRVFPWKIINFFPTIFQKICFVV